MRSIASARHTPSHLPLHSFPYIVNIKLHGVCGGTAPEVCKKRTRAECLVWLQLHPALCVRMGGTGNFYSQFLSPVWDTHYLTRRP